MHTWLAWQPKAPKTQAVPLAAAANHGPWLTSTWHSVVYAAFADKGAWPRPLPGMTSVPSQAAEQSDLQCSSLSGLLLNLTQGACWALQCAGMQHAAHSRQMHAQAPAHAGWWQSTQRFVACRCCACRGGQAAGRLPYLKTSTRKAAQNTDADGKVCDVPAWRLRGAEPGCRASASSQGRLTRRLSTAITLDSSTEACLSRASWGKASLQGICLKRRAPWCAAPLAVLPGCSSYLKAGKQTRTSQEARLVTCLGGTSWGRARLQDVCLKAGMAHGVQLHCVAVLVGCSPCLKTGKQTCNMHEARVGTCLSRASWGRARLQGVRLKAGVAHGVQLHCVAVLLGCSPGPGCELCLRPVHTCMCSAFATALSRLKPDRHFCLSHVSLRSALSRA